VIALGFCALIAIMAVVATLAQIELLQRIVRSDFTMAEVNLLDSRTRTVNLISSAAYLVTAFAFWFWIYRAYQNHETLARRGVYYSPAWAVVGFIIPLISLFRPYQVVSEMWDEAHVQEGEDPSSRCRRTRSSKGGGWASSP
jgi:hypothetical protein